MTTTLVVESLDYQIQANMLLQRCAVCGTIWHRAKYSVLIILNNNKEQVYFLGEEEKKDTTCCGVSDRAVKSFSSERLAKDTMRTYHKLFREIREKHIQCDLMTILPLITYTK